MQPSGAPDQFTLGYFMQEVLGVDLHKIVLGLVGIWIILWILAVLWVYNDAYMRYREGWKVFLWTTFVVVTSFFGYFVYLIFRPDYTLEEQELIYLNRKGVKYYADRVVKCYKCSAYVSLRKGVKYCYKCGALMVRSCSECGADNPYFARFCMRCGNVLATGIKNAKKVDYDDLVEYDSDHTDYSKKGEVSVVSRSDRIFNNNRLSNIKQKKSKTIKQSRKNMGKVSSKQRK